MATNNGAGDENTAVISGSDLKSSLTEYVLKLEEIDKNLYRSRRILKAFGGRRGVYGGQIIGQALVASSKTVPSHLHVHSLHCYFIRPGRYDRPMLYYVSLQRDGNSFCSRSVRAIQNGEVVLSMIVSYHKHEVSPIDYQPRMPTVTHHSELATTRELLKTLLESNSKLITEERRMMINKTLSHDIPFETKPINPENFYIATKTSLDPIAMYWVRVTGDIGDADNNLHRCMAAYLSDLMLLRTSLLPHPTFTPEMMASLDHSMWFHSHFRADEWMLYECESPRSGSARALVVGRLWKEDGTLAVTVAQEGVIRGATSSKL